MPVDAQEIESPGWWLNRLGNKLDKGRDKRKRLWDYYTGEHPIPEIPGVSDEDAREWMKTGRANWIALVVEAVRERLQVVGFRFGDEGAEGDRAADEIWQRNRLDSDSGLVHQAALVYGQSYVIVGYDDEDDGLARITPEHPDTVVTESFPGNPRRIAAALKVYWDDWAEVHRATVYTPERIYRFRTTSRTYSYGAPHAVQLGSWDYDPDFGGAAGEDNPLGVVPVVPFRVRPTLSYEGTGEFEDVTDLQDRINLSIINLLSAMKYGAFRQRWAAGLEVDEDPITGKTIEPLKLDIRKLWTVADENSRFGDFAETNLGPYIAAIENAIQGVAAITRTPPHYLLGQVVNVSGDALVAAESGLVSKARERQTHLGESWEEVMRLAGLIEGNADLAEATGTETLWRNAAVRSESQLADAVAKKKDIGVPFRQLAVDLGYTPQEIERMIAEKEIETLLATPPQLQGFAQNPPPPPGTPGGPPQLAEPEVPTSGNPAAPTPPA